MIITPHFFPENFKINDFAKKCIEKKHHVTVLTSIPNYPSGKFLDGYGIFKNRREIYNGIDINRVLVIPRGAGQKVRLSLNYLSYILFGLIKSLFLLNKNFDVIFVFGISPITAAIPAIFIKKVKKIPMCLWVLDLWPESVVAAGKLKTSLIPKLILPIVKYIYSQSDLVFISSRSFKPALKYRGCDEKKIRYMPQWAEQIYQNYNTNFSKQIDWFPKGFVIMFAGNIGDAQDFNSVLSSALKLKYLTDLHWVILGDGSKKAWLKSKIIENGLEKNFHLLGHFPVTDMPSFFSRADALLISLKDDHLYSLTVPAKLQSYLASGKPILGMMDGEGSRIIKESEAGFACASGDFHCLSTNVIKLMNANNKVLLKMGRSGHAYYKKYFSRDKIFNKVEIEMLSLVEKSSR